MQRFMLNNVSHIVYNCKRLIATLMFICRRLHYETHVRNMWLYEKIVNYFKLLLGATAKAQLMTKKVSYCIIMEDTEHRPFSDHLQLCLFTKCHFLL